MNCVMSTIKNMMPNKTDSEHNQHLHKNMQPIQNKDDDYKERYFAILAQKDKLDGELEGYRNLVHLLEKNQEKCDEVSAECERFLQVVLKRYGEVKRFQSDERERCLRRNNEREKFKAEIVSLLDKIKERDGVIQQANSENNRLMEKLEEGERDYQEEIETRSTTFLEMEQELDRTKEKLQSVTNNLEKAEQEKLEKINELDDLRIKTQNAIIQNRERSDQYMDQVADLHAEVNNIILRYNPIVRPMHPVRSNNYNKQLEAMKESITQLDEITSLAMIGRISQEDMDELHHDNEQLRQELEDFYVRLNKEQGRTNTLRMRCKYYNKREIEMIGIVDKFTRRESALRENNHLLYQKKVQLTAENSQYQDQIRTLQMEKNRLQEECDRNANFEAKETCFLEPEILHNNILLKEKMSGMESQVADKSMNIIHFDKLIDRVKMALRTNIQLIQTNDCLMTLLKDLENPIQASYTGWTDS